MAIMSVRESLEFETTIESDCAALNTLVAAMLETTPDIHVLRDPTRGGVATTLNEIASQSKVGIMIDETKIPLKSDVHSACELLGMDPIYVANEGKLIAIVAPHAADALLARMRAHPLGSQAQIIGTVTSKHPGMLVAKTLCNCCARNPFSTQPPRPYNSLHRTHCSSTPDRGTVSARQTHLRFSRSPQ